MWNDLCTQSSPFEGSMVLHIVDLIELVLFQDYVLFFLKERNDFEKWLLRLMPIS